MDLAIGKVGKTFILPSSVKPTAEQKKQVTKIKREMKKKSNVQNKKDNKEMVKWLLKQKKGGKLTDQEAYDYLPKANLKGFSN
jgi:hypothetical protein